MHQIGFLTAAVGLASAALAHGYSNPDMGSGYIPGGNSVDSNGYSYGEGSWTSATSAVAAVTTNAASWSEAAWPTTSSVASWDSGWLWPTTTSNAASWATASWHTTTTSAVAAVMTTNTAWSSTWHTTTSWSSTWHTTTSWSSTWWQTTTSTHTTMTTSSMLLAPTASASCSLGMWPFPNALLVQIVQVSDANGSLTYWPDQIVAPPGSIVQFQFNPKNHTVTQSSFAAPCQPLALTNRSAITPTNTGVDSGFVPVAIPNKAALGQGELGTFNNVSVFNLMVNSSEPIWIYCAQTGHCAKGMAMVINENPESGNTLAAYKAAAAALAPPVASGVPYGAGASWPMTSKTSMSSMPAVTMNPVAPYATSVTSVAAPMPPPVVPVSAAPNGSPIAADSPSSTLGFLTFTGAAQPIYGPGRGAAAGLVGLFAAGALL